MAHYFFSRRAFHQGSFTGNMASLTRYFRLNALTNGPLQLSRFADVDDFVTEVSNQAAGHGVVCFIHGFNTSQREMLERMIKIEEGLRANSGFRGVVIGFDWPSEGLKTEYQSDRNDAKASAQHLMPDALSPLLNRLGASQLHLVAHSMGARVTTRSFERSSDRFGAGWKLGQVVFIAADIDFEELERGNSYEMSLAARSSRFSSYYSGFDDVLAIAGGIINGGRLRLGREGLPDLTNADFHQVDCTQFYGDNFSTVFDVQRSHAWYFDNPAFYADLGTVLSGAAQPTRRVL